MLRVPGRLLAHLCVDLNPDVGEDVAAVDDPALGGAHLRDARIWQGMAFKVAVVRHDDDAVLVGHEGAGMGDPVTQPRDPHFGHDGADQQAVGINRRCDEDARFAARAAHAISFRKRAEQGIGQIAAGAHVDADEGAFRGERVIDGVARSDAGAVGVDEPDLIEPGEALRIMQEAAHGEQLRVL